MSSIEIAELTRKDHAHVLRDIRVMLDEIKDDPNLDHLKISKDSRGYTSEIRLPRDLTEVLITGWRPPAAGGNPPARTGIRSSQASLQGAYHTPWHPDDGCGTGAGTRSPHQHVGVLEENVVENAPKIDTHHSYVYKPAPASL